MGGATPWMVLAGACMLTPLPARADVTVEPVGPESAWVYWPFAINERGDVMFQIYAGRDPAWDPATPSMQTEVIYADGTSSRLDDIGYADIYPSLLLENGDLVARYGTLGERQPNGGTPVNFEPRLIGRHGSSQVITGTRQEVNIRDAAPDGTLIGSTAASWDWNDQGYVDPSAPMVWTPTTGATELPLPGDYVSGSVGWVNPAGGCVGGASDGLFYGRSVYAWWNASGQVTATVDSHVLTSTTSWDIVGARDDGALVGYIDSRAFALHPDGTLQYLTEPMLGLRVFGVNASGLMLVEYVTEQFEGRELVMTPGGQSIDLGTYFAGSGWSIRDLIDITDAGDVLVYCARIDQTDTLQAFVIHGIPGPSGASLALVAGLGTLSRRRRRSPTPTSPLSRTRGTP